MLAMVRMLTWYGRQIHRLSAVLTVCHKVSPEKLTAPFTLPPLLPRAVGVMAVNRLLQCLTGVFIHKWYHRCLWCCHLYNNHNVQHFLNFGSGNQQRSWKCKMLKESNKSLYLLLPLFYRKNVHKERSVDDEDDGERRRSSRSRLG